MRGLLGHTVDRRGLVASPHPTALGPRRRATEPCHRGLDARQTGYGLMLTIRDIVHKDSCEAL